MAINGIGQAGISQSVNHNKQRCKEHEQVPIDQFEHFMRIATREHHHQGRARKCRPRQIQPCDEADEDRHKHNANDRKQNAIKLRDRVRFPLDCCCSQSASKANAQNDKVDREADNNRRCERQGKLRKRDSGEMSDDLFCGLPTSVATLPMLALVASAIRYGSSGSFPRRITAMTSGVNIKQIVSFISNADRVPDVSIR